MDGRIATTKSGTKYYLGTPSAEFVAVRVCSARAALRWPCPLAGCNPPSRPSLKDLCGLARQALLCRATAAAELGPTAAAAAALLPFDPERPFDYIDLGPMVACSSVKLPVVAGWSADSNAAPRVRRGPKAWPDADQPIAPH